MKRVDGVFELESSLRDGSGLNPAGAAGQNGPMVEFKHVSFSYGEAQSEALTDLFLLRHEGADGGSHRRHRFRQIYACKLDPRFYDAGKGRVFVDGRDAKEYSIKELRSIIGSGASEGSAF